VIHFSKHVSEYPLICISAVRNSLLHKSSFRIPSVKVGSCFVYSDQPVDGRATETDVYANTAQM